MLHRSEHTHTLIIHPLPEPQDIQLTAKGLAYNVHMHHQQKQVTYGYTRTINDHGLIGCFCCLVQVQPVEYLQDQAEVAQTAQ